MNLKIAMLQLMPGKMAAEQLEKGIVACHKAKELGADIALFPEMWSNGYELPQEDGAINELAVSADSRFVGEFKKLSAELQMAVGIRRSTVFDGVAWSRNEPGVRDMCVFEAPEEEGVFIAEIDLDMLRDYREHEVMGDKYRHLEKYQLLTVRV